MLDSCWLRSRNRLRFKHRETFRRIFCDRATVLLDVICMFVTGITLSDAGELRHLITLIDCDCEGIVAES